jgi:hypothetical protein
LGVEVRAVVGRAASGRVVAVGVAAGAHPIKLARTNKTGIATSRVFFGFGNPLVGGVKTLSTIVQGSPRKYWMGVLGMCMGSTPVMKKMRLEFKIESAHVARRRRL